MHIPVVVGKVTVETFADLIGEGAQKTQAGFVVQSQGILCGDSYSVKNLCSNRSECWVAGEKMG
jgi:myo-inositol catabolism protein IolC